MIPHKILVKVVIKIVNIKFIFNNDTFSMLFPGLVAKEIFITNLSPK